MNSTPTLADLVMACCSQPTRHVHEPGVASLQRAIALDVSTRMRQSWRYVLEGDVVAAATELGAEHPDILLAMLRSARTPFPRIWMEWEMDSSTSPQLSAEQRVASRCGLFIEQVPGRDTEFRSLVCFVDDGMLRLSWLFYHWRLDEPLRPSDWPAGTHKLQSCFPGATEILERAPVGNAFTGWVAAAEDSGAKSYREGVCARLSAHVCVSIPDILSPHIPASRLTPVIQSIVTEFAGEWLTTIAVLALLQNAELIGEQVGVRTRPARMVGNKNVPYLDYRTSVLRLSRQETRERLLRTVLPSLPRRAHGVSGHWRQNRKFGDPNCSHLHVADTATREVCVLCGHKRWWVADFQRGDAGVGFVSTDRVVRMS